MVSHEVFQARGIPRCSNPRLPLSSPSKYKPTLASILWWTHTILGYPGQGTKCVFYSNNFSLMSWASIVKLLTLMHVYTSCEWFMDSQESPMCLCLLLLMQSSLLLRRDSWKCFAFCSESTGDSCYVKGVMIILEGNQGERIKKTTSEHSSTV